MCSCVIFTKLAYYFRLIYPLKCALLEQWIYQQPMMMEQCFNFLNTLPWAGDSVCNVRLCLHGEKLLLSFDGFLLHCILVFRESATCKLSRFVFFVFDEAHKHIYLQWGCHTQIWMSWIQELRYGWQMLSMFGLVVAVAFWTWPHILQVVDHCFLHYYPNPLFLCPLCCYWASNFQGLHGCC